MSHPVPPSAPDPRRFEVARFTLWFDRFMGWAIRLGGVSVILAVFGIFFFIGKEVVPLFRGAEVAPAGEVPAPANPGVLGLDEWGEQPFFYQGGRTLTFVDLRDGSRRELEIELPAPLEEGADIPEITAYSYDPVAGRLALGTSDGRVGSVLVRYERRFEDGRATGSDASLESEPWFPLDHGEGPVTAVSYGDSGGGRIIAASRGGETPSVSILRLGIRRGLVGGGTLTLQGETSVADQLPAAPRFLRSSQNGSLVLVTCENGEVLSFSADAQGAELRQTFRPFGDEAPDQLEFLFGGVSLIATASDGRQSQWSLFRETEDAPRTWGETKTFPSLGGSPSVFASSLRNRAFLTGSGSTLSVRYSTSGAIRWEGELEFEPVAVALDGKGESFIVAAADGSAHRYRLHDPHPEAGWRAFFGKVWYEGGSGPVYQWQSTGGTDDFESKLSLVPLIFGSLKGTLYAMLFSVPVALLAAIFSAIFLPHSVKRIVKPAMEIMSSLPSVVLGFLAGLWLAPLLADRVPSVLLAVTSVPLTALAVGYAWCHLPIHLRNRLEGGREWLLVLPFLALSAWIAWSLGPVVERFLFAVTDPETGIRVGDFRRWWPEATGLRYEERNSLVLGFVMGFAVIPVIFTIAEDALSNVPKSLTAAAYALGATRWQVVWTVLLPVASSGIFSALMIGFGRAVGETMIMVMATGSTPITEWNIFSGMRTLSANLAIELPEASEGSTHYRTLFLGAVVLFGMTFVMNTIAEILRQRLRERNKLV